MPRLAICIPTHDGRAGVLERLLDNLSEQLVPGIRERVQIVVSDNGSADATATLLAERAASLGATLVTHRFEKNVGLTRNLLKSIEVADADYCWTLGSDDLVAEGGVAEVLRVLDLHPDTAGVTLNRYRVNFFDPDRRELDPPRELPANADSLQLYTSARDVFENVGLSQDYISTQVVDRRLLLDVVAKVDPALIDSFELFYLYAIGRAVQERPRWVWSPRPIVQHTTGTSALDEELGHNYAKFQVAVMDGRVEVWSALFGKGSELYRGVMRKAYLRSAQPNTLIGLKLPGNQTYADDLRLLVKNVGYFGWIPSFWLRSFPVLVAPHSLLKALSRVKQRVLRTRAGRRLQRAV